MARRIDQSVSRHPPCRRADILRDAPPTAFSASPQRSSVSSLRRRRQRRSLPRNGGSLVCTKSSLWYPWQTRGGNGRCCCPPDAADSPGGEVGSTRRTPERTSPLYLWLAELLREQIGKAGQLDAHGLVPSERVLSERYDVSRMTARHALRDAHARGIPLPPPPSRHLRRRATSSLQPRELHPSHDGGWTGRRAPRSSRPRPSTPIHSWPRNWVSRPAAGCTCCSGCQFGHGRAGRHRERSRACPRRGSRTCSTAG